MNYVERYEIGSKNFLIAKKGREYFVCLNGGRVGELYWDKQDGLSSRRSQHTKIADARKHIAEYAAFELAHSAEDHARIANSEATALRWLTLKGASHFACEVAK